MSKLKLTDAEWTEFKVKDIFEVTNSKPYHKQNLKTTQRGIPYITRTSFNNGLEEIIEDVDFRKNPQNTITLGAENADFFYQSVEYITGNKMYYIQNENITKNIGLFLVQSFRNSIKDSGFGYGKGLTGTRFKERLVMLPIDSQGHPNWQFMEDYIKQEQKVQAQQVIDYYERKLVELAGDVVGLEKVEWKTFRLGEVFDLITKGSKGLNHLEKGLLKGISYVGATNRNNGVLDFVEQKESLIYSGNAIAFIRNGEGSMGYSVYKKEDFIATQDITVGYNENLNEYNAKFISTVADQVRGKYNFGYKRNQERLKRETLTLPADKNGNPDFQYMSDFVKKLELEKVRETLGYIYQIKGDT